MFALVGCLLGLGGLHRFYLGKPWTGVLWLLTGGLFVVGQVVDIVRICLGCMRDGEGRPLCRW